MWKELEHLATLKIYDRADEFRIEVAGRFAGDCVNEIAVAWKEAAYLEGGARRFVVNISRLTSYDNAGRKLLRQMYRHGIQIAAGTPNSLVFLSEISAPERRGPAFVTEPAPPRRYERQPSLPARAMAVNS